MGQTYKFRVKENPVSKKPNLLGEFLGHNQDKNREKRQAAKN
jgi:hypothetical protein